MAQLKTETKSMKNVPGVWQDYLGKMLAELKIIERDLQKLDGAKAPELHARAQKLQTGIALLK